MKTNPGSLAGGGEVRVLAQEAIAGMNGIGPVALRGVEDAVDVEVAFGGRRGTDVRGLVGEAHMHGGPIGIRVDRDAADAEFLQRAIDAHGNLTPIGDQDFAEHVYLLLFFSLLVRIALDLAAAFGRDERDGQVFIGRRLSGTADLPSFSKRLRKAGSVQS